LKGIEVRLDTGNFPTSIDELEDWQRQHKTTKEDARRRLVQFVVLASMSSSTALVSRVAFKGGNALQFMHGNLRSTLDLDFSADGDFPDNADVIKQLMDNALRTTEQRYQFKAKCQSCHRKPPGLDRTKPTYDLKVGYQFAGDRYYRNFEEQRSFPQVVQIEISLNDVLCETAEHQLQALLQQIPRRRSRPQDVFDIASMVRLHGNTLDLSKVSAFLVQKSEAREIVAAKSSFNASVREKAIVNYQKEISRNTTAFIPFDEAWDEVLLLVSRLSIPD
jgi:Nucleotidyl transferase AbiEii toxin, Type IV TA system